MRRKRTLRLRLARPMAPRRQMFGLASGLTTLQNMVSGTCFAMGTSVLSSTIPQKLFSLPTPGVKSFFDCVRAQPLSANILVPHSRVEYVERRKVGGGSYDDKRSFQLTSHPAELTKKVTLLKHFKNYLLEHTPPGQETPSGGATIGSSMIYVKKWLRTRHAFIFRLSNKTIQVCRPHPLNRSRTAWCRVCVSESDIPGSLPRPHGDHPFVGGPRGDVHGQAAPPRNLPTR